jgi:hypothetical protein
VSDTFGTGDAVTQAFAEDATITSIKGQVVTQQPESMPGTVLSVTATLYIGPAGTPPQTTPTTCTAGPPFTGNVAVGTAATFDCSVSIPVLAGDVGYVGLTALAQGASAFNTVELQAAVSLGLD